LALLCGGRQKGAADGFYALMSVLISVATAALSAGRRKGGVMAEAAAKYNPNAG